jgi:hypothetical protein
MQEKDGISAYLGALDVCPGKSSLCKKIPLIMAETLGTALGSVNYRP